MTERTALLAGLPIVVVESGRGRPVLLVHDMAGGRSVWDETVSALGGRARTVAYDRRGYGASGAPDPYLGTTVEEQAEEAVALLDAPAVLCGHGFGALICLDVLRRHPGAACGAVLIHPLLPALSPAGSDLMSGLRECIEEAVRRGGPGGAVEAYLTFIGGAASLERLGPARTEAARRAARAFAADLAAVSAWDVGRRALRALAAPVTVLVGTGAHRVIAEVAGALTALLPAARLKHLAAVSHVPQVEDPGGVAGAIEEIA